MAKKGYNRLNYLKQCKIIIDIVNTHYKGGYTTYAGVFRTFIEPYYPMHYNTFMRIINAPNIELQIKREMERIKVFSDSANQQELF